MAEYVIHVINELYKITKKTMFKFHSKSCLVHLFSPLEQSQLIQDEDAGPVETISPPILQSLSRNFLSQIHLPPFWSLYPFFPSIISRVLPTFLISNRTFHFSSRVLITIRGFDMQIMVLIIHAWDLLLPPRAWAIWSGRGRVGDHLWGESDGWVSYSRNVEEKMIGFFHFNYALFGSWKCGKWMKSNYNTLGSFPIRERSTLIFHSTVSLFWVCLRLLIIGEKTWERESWNPQL